MHQPRPVLRSLPILLLLLSGCDDDNPAPGTLDAASADAGPSPDAGPPDAGESDAGFVPDGLARYCGTRWWETTLEPATVGELHGTSSGYVNRTLTGGPLQPGTLEAIAITPAHPFLVRTIRVAFANGSGTARIRLVKSYGRSYPANKLGISDTGDVDVVPPVEIDVTRPNPNTWIDLDVSAANAVLAPGAVYHVVYEHLTAAPFLALESVPAGEPERSALFFPGSVEAYGVPGNYRLQLAGDYACAWSDADRWFHPHPTAAFEGRPGGEVHVVDLDGDGNDDIVSPGSGHPQVFMGDGHGVFAAAATSPFPADESAHVMLFGDLDNDGDQDSFAAVYVQSDADGDGVAVFEGDCEDTKPDVKPGRVGGDVAGNGLDDDCDGVTDDGMATTDADSDTFTIAAGDCDDTDAMIHDGTPELADNRDNDCDGTVDEGFNHHVLLNDGTGHFTRLTPAGVEMQGPTLAAALDDANSDGRLDLFVGFWLRHYPDAPTQPSLFYLGNGDGTFREATAAARMVIPVAHPVYGVMWNDWNDDGRDDLYVGHYQLQDNLFFRNDGGGTFTDVAAAIGVAHDAIPSRGGVGYPGGHSYGGDFGDVDGDGDFDALLCNLSHPRTMPWADPTMFVINEGAPDYHYADRTQELGIPYNEGDGNAHFGDIDNDGDLDVYVASFYGRNLRAFRNDGAAGFVDVTYELGFLSRTNTGVWSDFDADGDLDFATSNDGILQVYLNQLDSPSHWVELLLEGTTSNRDAVGARITVVAGGRTFVRDVRPTGGHANRQPSRWNHVGLGTAAAIDSVSIRWPGGTVERVTGVTLDHRYFVRQGTGAAMMR